VPGADPVDAAAAGAEALESALARLHLVGWTIVRIHAASVEERLRDRYLGLEENLVREDICTVLMRLESSEPGQRADVAQLRAVLPDAAELFDEPGVVEAKWWVGAAHAGEASLLVAGLLASDGWRVTRHHVCTVSEVARLHYFGVDRRLV